MAPVLEDLPFHSGDEVLLFVNGLGGTPLIELYIVYRKAEEIARAHGLKVTRRLVGSYITSLEMAGASITLLKLDAEMTQLWDARCLSVLGEVCPRRLSQAGIVALQTVCLLV